MASNSTEVDGGSNKRRKSYDSSSFIFVVCQTMIHRH